MNDLQRSHRDAAIQNLGKAQRALKLHYFRDALQAAESAVAHIKDVQWAGGAEAADAASPGAVEAPGPIEVESGSDCEKPIVASAEAARPGNSLPDSLDDLKRIGGGVLVSREWWEEQRRLDRRQDGEI